MGGLKLMSRRLRGAGEQAAAGPEGPGAGAEPAGRGARRFRPGGRGGERGESCVSSGEADRRGEPGHLSSGRAGFGMLSGRGPGEGMGQPPENRRQAVVKLLWMVIWMLYLGAPVTDLLHGHHGQLGTALGVAGLIGYIGVYLMLVFRRMGAPAYSGVVYGQLALLLVLALALSLTLGNQWLVLFVYFSVASGAVLPLVRSRWAICGGAAILVALGLSDDSASDLWPSLVIPAMLGGFAMAGVRRLVSTTKELREARATVAQLAASDERLRLARDLHDLLGHSLSLITLKSELAGRMLPGDPEAAAGQVADIEQVSRQALVDVREAVSDYRRPTLGVELASASTAFAAAGLAVDLPTLADVPELHCDQESALAWALREASTNVIRHSEATRCTVSITEQADDTLCLTVTDNGRGPSGPTGNGLTGLAERLALADGSLETDAGVRGGFRLRATVPFSPPASAVPADERPVTLPT